MKNRPAAKDQENRNLHDNLLASEERFYQAILVAPYPLMIRREDGQVVMVNRAWTRITGYTLGDIPTIAEWTRKAYGESASQRQAIIMHEGFSHEGVKSWGEYEVTTLWGEKRIWEFSTASLGLDSQSRRLVMIMAVDVTEQKSAETELQNLARFPGENPHPVLRISAGGLVLYANQSSQELLRSWGVGDGGATPEFLMEIIRNSLETNTVQNIEQTIGTKTLAITFAAIPEGGYVNVYGADITSQKQSEALLKERNETLQATLTALQESEARLKRSQEIAHLGSWELDLIRNTLTWSDEVYRIFGLVPQEFGATYEAFLDAVHPDDRAAVDATYSGSLHEGRDGYEIEHRVIRKSTGEIRVVHEKCEHTRDRYGKIIRSIGMVHDVTERRRAEEALSEFARKLERSNRDLEQFAFVASHDLQEPLRKVQIFVDRLTESEGRLDDQQRVYLERMQSAAGRMKGMVDGLLQLSRVSTQGQPFARVDLSDVAAEVLSDLEEQVARTGGKVEIDKLPVVEGDPLQLCQLLQNLIGNALKYHHPDIGPVVRVRARQISSRVEILVEDNGIGFDQEDVEKIFQPFQRLVGRSEYEGSGMGLSICKKIVERHSGEITAKGAPGKGATFIVSLPVNAGAVSSNQPAF